MDYLTNIDKEKLAAGLLGIIVVGVVLVFIIMVSNVSRHITTVPTGEQKSVNKIEELGVGANQQLASFPDIPLPADRFTFVRTQKVTSPQGKVQLTKIAESSKSVSDNFAYFKNYLSGHASEWKIVSEVNGASDITHKAIFATSAKGILNINISSNPLKGGSTVDVSFLLN
jgi:hypothetical protein